MKKIYLIHHNSDRTFSRELDEIKQINPDLVLLFLLEEYDIQTIFRELLSKLSNWLVENNKLAKILVINPDNYEVAPNIVTEKTFGYQFNIRGTIDQFTKKNIDFTKSHTYATKLFTCYNDNPKYHRAATIDKLVQENLLEYGIVTYHQPNYCQSFSSTTDSYKFKYYNMNPLFDEEEYDRYNKSFDSSQMARSFLKGFFDIVTETTIHPEQPFLTEKTGKSIAALKPFLTIGSVNFHKYIENEYGIEPYPELFDYSFDSDSTIHGRIHGVIENVKRLKYLMFDEQKRNKIHDLLLDRMIRNKDNLYNYTFNKDKMMIKSLNFINEPDDYTLFGHVEKCQYVFDFYKQMGWSTK